MLPGDMTDENFSGVCFGSMQELRPDKTHIHKQSCSTFAEHECLTQADSVRRVPLT